MFKWKVLKQIYKEIFRFSVAKGLFRMFAKRLSFLFISRVVKSRETNRLV